MDSMRIKNVDVGLHSANMIDTFVDMGIFKYSESIEHRELFISMLNQDLSVSGVENVVFSGKSKFEKTDYNVKRSEGSVAVQREKTYLAFAQFEDLVINESTCRSLDNAAINPEEDDFSFIEEFKILQRNLRADKLTISDVEVKFGLFGEVVFFGRAPLRNENLSIPIYKRVSKFLFKATRAYYKDIVTAVCKSYLTSLMNVHHDANNRILILEPLHSNILVSNSDFDMSEVRRRCLHSLTWSHYIYDDVIYNAENPLNVLREIVINEVGVINSEMIYSRNTKIFIGWSHSIFLTTDLDENSRNEFVHFFKIPIEVEWGEWEFLRSLNKKADIALYESYKKLEDKAFKYRKLSSYKNQVDRFYYFSRRILKSYDGLSMTVNPTQLDLIKKQRSVWKLDLFKNEFIENLDALSGIIAYLSDRKKESNSRILNGILFIIALLSIIDISNTVYGIINSNNQEYMISTLLPASTVFVILLMYLRITKD